MTTLANTESNLDPEKLGMFSFQVFSKLEGAVTAGMIHLGDKLGLYRALADATTPLTTHELAALVGLHERWVREWAYNQAAARIIDTDTDEHFSLSAEAAAVLATPEHPAYGMGMFHRLPQTMRTLDAMPESFRTGIGHDYDAHGCEGAAASSAVSSHGATPTCSRSCFPRSMVSSIICRLA